ncbi:hypothetical protein Tco_0355312 [Tanacetum coccineum]
MKIEDLNSASIHLDENWQAKIRLITPSALIDTAAPTLSAVHQLVTPTVYRVEEGGTPFLSKLARNHYEKGTLTEIIDPLLRVQMNRDSIAIFSEVACRCLNPFTRQRMSVVIEQLQKVLELQQGFEISKLEQQCELEIRLRNVDHKLNCTIKLGILKKNKIRENDCYWIDEFVISLRIQREERRHEITNHE